MGWRSLDEVIQTRVQEYRPPEEPDRKIGQAEEVIPWVWHFLVRLACSKTGQLVDLEIHEGDVAYFPLGHS